MFRKLNGYRIIELANIIGICESTLSKLERGEKVNNILINKIVKTTNELFGLT